MAGGLTYQEAYQWGYGELTRAGIAEARLDARLLLEWCCGTDHNTFFAHGERLVTEEENRRYVFCFFPLVGAVTGVMHSVSPDVRLTYLCSILPGSRNLWD